MINILATEVINGTKTFLKAAFVATLALVLTTEGPASLVKTEENPSEENRAVVVFKGVAKATLSCLIVSFNFKISRNSLLNSSLLANSEKTFASLLCSNSPSKS